MNARKTMEERIRFLKGAIVRFYDDDDDEWWLDDTVLVEED